MGGYDRVFTLGGLWRVFSVWVHGQKRVFTVSGSEKVFTTYLFNTEISCQTQQ